MIADSGFVDLILNYLSDNDEDVADGLDE